MTYSFDTDIVLDGESLAETSIALSPGQIEQAIHLSQSIPDAAQQWQTYLNALARFGFEQWLQERTPALTVRDDRPSLPPPQPISPTDAVCRVTVGDFKLCLIAMGSLSDTVVTGPEGAIASPHAAQLYVVVEVQEEQDQVMITACLRSDQLRQHQQTHPLHPEPAGTYSLPLTWFDRDPNALLLHLRCLEPAALPLGISPPAAAASLEPSSLTPYSPLPTPHSSILNAALWLRNQLDAVAQELAWVLLPPPIASALRSSSVLSGNPAIDQFEQLVTELGRSGVAIPPAARGAHRDLLWGERRLRLYAVIWELPSDTAPEWTLLLVLGSPSGAPIPPGVTLRVQDEEQVLVERTITSQSQDAYLYARVIGTWDEQFWVTVDMANGAVVTLPPFGFIPSP